MVYLVEFKLHGGMIPYFIAECLGGVVSSTNKYYGVTIDEDYNYIPETLTKLTRDEFINKIKLIDIIKNDPNTGSEELMTEEEKTVLVENWLSTKNL